MKEEKIIYFILIVLFLLFFYGIFSIAAKRLQLKKYSRIELGMLEEEMLNIMGGGYNKSLLKNGSVKYEWRLNGTSSSAGGVRSYSGVKKVDIYCKEGEVIEVRPYNVH